jgi:crotonobetainyl-CoA:carnitine CoA-transferase CaiB-like acyl-CoA transferase
VLRRGETAPLAHPLHGPVEGVFGPGLPIRFSAAETALGPPPLLGEHNESVYRELAGYSAEELADLAARGVV